MSQEEILSILEENGIMSFDEIWEALQINERNIEVAVAKLMKHQEINRIFIQQRRFYIENGLYNDLCESKS